MYMSSCCCLEVSIDGPLVWNGRGTCRERKAVGQGDMNIPREQRGLAVHVQPAPTAGSAHAAHPSSNLHQLSLDSRPGHGGKCAAVQLPIRDLPGRDLDGGGETCLAFYALLSVCRTAVSPWWSRPWRLGSCWPPPCPRTPRRPSRRRPRRAAARPIRSPSCSPILPAPPRPNCCTTSGWCAGSGRGGRRGGSPWRRRCRRCSTAPASAIDGRPTAPMCCSASRAGRGARCVPAVPDILVVGRRLLNTDIKRTENDIQPYKVFTGEEIETAHRDNIGLFFRARLPTNTDVVAPAQQILAALGATAIDQRPARRGGQAHAGAGRRPAAAQPARPRHRFRPVGPQRRADGRDRADRSADPPPRAASTGRTRTGGVVNVVLKARLSRGAAQCRVGHHQPGRRGAGADRGADRPQHRRRIDAVHGLRRLCGQRPAARRAAGLHPALPQDGLCQRSGRLSLLSRRDGLYAAEQRDRRP